MRVLITAGGTFEPIDDVRGITNRSTGRLGAALSNAFVQQGADVHLLASEALAARSDWLSDAIRVTSFLSYRDLQGALEDACGVPYDVVLMAAAVADYSPVPHRGKLPSHAPEQQLLLRRNPKLLSRLSERCHPSTRVIGFKLMSNVSRDQLTDTALAQVKAYGLAACVANDMAEIVGDRHPVTLVQASGRTTRIEGSKQETAEQLVAALLNPKRT